MTDFMKLKPLSILLQLLIFSVIHIKAQPDIVWQQCFGTSESDYFNDAIITSDDGYLVSTTYGGTDGDAEGQDSLIIPAILLKFDSEFNLEWQRNFGGASGTSFFDVIHEIPDGYICGGISYAVDGDFADNHGAHDLVVVKTDLNGNKIWSHCYGGPLDDYFTSMISVSDGGYIVSGYSNGSGGDIPFHYGDAMSPDAIILKLNINGEIEWIKVLGGSFVDSPLANPVEITPGNYQIHIYSASDDYDLASCGITDIQKRWIIEMNDEGEIIKQNFMSAEDDFFRSDGQLMVLNDNSTMMVGTGNAASTLFPATEGHLVEEGAIAKFDTNLTMTFMKQWGGSGIDKFVRCEKDYEGDFYFMGFSSSDDYDLPSNYNNGTNNDYWIMKTDSLYNLIWSKNFGGSDFGGDLGGSYFEGNFVIKNNSLYFFSKCVVPENFPDYDINCGHEPPNNIIPYTDAWLVAFDLGTPIFNIHPTEEIFNLFPNPVNGILKINSTKYYSNIIVNIFDVTSTNIYSKNFVDSFGLNISTNDFPNGFYLINVSNNTRLLYSTKFIVQH